MKKRNGFTLIELMVVLAVAAILATMGAPAFWSMIQNSRTTTQANELVTAINVARSEAIKRGERVQVCASTDQLNCDTADWEGGWIVRLENGADPVIRVWDALPDSANIGASAGELTFRSMGERVGGNAFTFTVAFAGCTGDQQRRIRVNAAGRPSVVREAC